MTFGELAMEVRTVLRKGVGRPLPDGTFNELALAVFRFQCRENRPYGGFVARRRVNPESLTRWEDIPFLPTRAFKSATLVSGDPVNVERVFRTSGTTGGRERRGEHHVLDLDLYRESLLSNFKTNLLTEEWDPIRVLCLLPAPEAAPDSSLSFMMGEVVEAVGDEGSGFFVDGEGGLDGTGFFQALQVVESGESPVMLAGTAFGFVRWLELAENEGWKVPLPTGSRIMETGGYKGRSMELPRARLYLALDEALGVPASRIVNEYGMTELLSQFYEPVLSSMRESESSGEGAGVSVLDGRFHRPPPWVRTLVLDPFTLERLPPGGEGVLAHLDLANVGSVAAILTEDLGREVPGGFQLLGRNPGSEPRGCSLAMEDFLASREV